MLYTRLGKRKETGNGGVPRDKSITFVDKDAQLIKKIVAYQKERGISSFVETVRQLCEKALKFSEITK